MPEFLEIIVRVRARGHAVRVWLPCDSGVPDIRAAERAVLSELRACRGRGVQAIGRKIAWATNANAVEVYRLPSWPGRLFRRAAEGGVVYYRVWP